MIEARLKFRQDGARGIGQFQPRRARRRAVKELHADNRLQAANETAHCRGRHVEFFCRRNIAEVARRGLEGTKRVQVIGRSHQFRRKFFYAAGTDHLCCGREGQRSWFGPTDRGPGTRALQER